MYAILVENNLCNLPFWGFFGIFRDYRDGVVAGAAAGAGFGAAGARVLAPSPTTLLAQPLHATRPRMLRPIDIQVSPYFDPTHTRTGWIGQPPILNRHEVVTDNGDVDTLGQATP